MKNIINTIAFTLITVSLFAQIPANMTYQGVASNSDGEILINSQLGLFLEILDREDEIVYSETHTTTSSEKGIFSVLLGDGEDRIGSISGINWGEGGHQIRVSMDTEGGTDYEEIGVSNLSSVPYAFYGKDEDANPSNELQSIYSKPAGPAAIDLFLTQSEDSVRIAMGLDSLISSFIAVPHDVNGILAFWLQSNPLNRKAVDASPFNELQTLTSEIRFDENLCFVTDLFLTDMGGFQHKVTIDDTDATNEIQKLKAIERTDIVTQSKVTELRLESFKGDLDSIIIFDTDHLNEIQTPSLTLVSGEFGVEGSFNLNKLSSPAITFPDLDPFNEIQNLFLDGNVIGITGGSAYELPLSPWQSVTNTSIKFEGGVSIQHNNTTLAQLVCDGPGYFSNVTGTNNIFSNNFRTPSGDLMMNDDYIMLNNNVFINNEGLVQANTIVAEIKNFVMDHPEDETKEIYYVSLEGPEAGAYERGTAKLENGECFVAFSEHFKLVKGDNVPTVILTPQSIDTYGLAVVEKRANGFVVKELKGGNGNFKFDWEVKSVRSGFEDYKVIRDKK